ncbi:HlyD family type I secretion periplasmic adaptor subunit [Salinarimonas soli]|uniref:Membrane fusion protein (MFP) family protein n=1 Tax=Salinarimonas soli TaxID=1638099 RepID=A0A5B2V8J9_9HYPH|nr:HlyD family type I secretion periplasmic adaptor subunit [Salinarimonas soli]KAA2235068.1 HlyD family type I secretion periplasmic adaptor subunit [Salinarimonas soli]
MTAPTQAQRSIRRHILAGTTIFGAVVFGLGGWAATAQLSGAVIAPGVVVVDSNVKKVQHPTGGIVAELLVREGQLVREGEVLVRLDETVTRANLAVVRKSIDELVARQARLEAERDGAGAITFPSDLLERAANPDVGRAMRGEQSLFDLRSASRAGQKSQLRERVGQLRDEIDGMDTQIQARQRENVLIATEIEGVRDLHRKNLVTLQRVTAIERDAVRTEGELGRLAAARAQAKGKITETELQILQVDQELRSEVAKELRDIQSKMVELVERQVTAEDQLKRIDVRSPQTGRVHQLAVHTVGGVVSPGEPMMLVVPKSDELTVEARVAPQDIDQIRPGQSAVLRLSAFNQRTTPEIYGEVTRISADVSTDQRTGMSHYTIRISLPASELAKIKDLTLTPGMPVESFVRTADRTALNYFTKPLMDQVNRAFREE